MLFGITSEEVVGWPFSYWQINVVNVVNQFKLMKHCFRVQSSEKQTTGDPDLIRFITLLLCVELSKSRFSNYLLSTIGLFVFIKTCLYTCYVLIHLTFLGLFNIHIKLFFSANEKSYSDSTVMCILVRIKPSPRFWWNHP